MIIFKKYFSTLKPKDEVLEYFQDLKLKLNIKLTKRLRHFGQWWGVCTCRLRFQKKLLFHSINPLIYELKMTGIYLYIFITEYYVQIFRCVCSLPHCPLFRYLSTVKA